MIKRNFTEEQRLFRLAFRRFLEKEVVPHLERFRKQGIVDAEIFRKAGEQGYLMIWPDEKYGGMGDSDFRFEQIIIEETCYAGCGDWYNTLHSRLVGPYLQHFGNEAQREKYLPQCVTGERIMAIAMTEPDAGSDVSGIRTHAKDCGDHYLLNGSKTYISNGINGNLFMVAAKTDPDNNPHTMGLFLVEGEMEGFKRGRNLEKMGLKAQDTAELFFDNVKVPKKNVLGDPTQGFKYLMQGLAEERLIGAASYIANSQLAFDITRDYVMSRKAFGKAISDFQNTQFKMAEMRAEIDMQQIYVDHLVEAHNRGELSAEDAAKAKLLTSETLCKVVDECLQLHGGAGYMDEYMISRLYTDARITRIFAGSSEIMKLIISREIFKESYLPFPEKI